MNRPNLRPAIVPLILALAMSRGFAVDLDNPPIDSDSTSIQSATVTQIEHYPGSLVLIGPETIGVQPDAGGSAGIDGTKPVAIRKDRFGYYVLRFQVFHTCTSNPTVVLADDTGRRWEQQAQPTGNEYFAEFSLIAHQVSLPISVQICTPSSLVALTGTLDGPCSECNSCATGGSGEVTGSLNSAGEGGANGEFSGSFDVGTSDQGDTHTSLAFNIDPTLGLPVGKFKIRSSGGYVRTITDSTTITTGTTTTTFDADSDTDTVTVTMVSLVGGTHPASRSIVFDNSVAGTLKATLKDTDDIPISHQEWRYSASDPDHDDKPTWKHVTGEGLRLEVLIRVNSNGTRVDRRKIYEGTSPENGPIIPASDASDDDLVSDVQTTYTLYGTQWKKTSEVIAPGQNGPTTTWSYYATGEATGAASYAGAGLLTMASRHNGQDLHHYSSSSHIVDSGFAGAGLAQRRSSTWASAGAAGSITASTTVTTTTGTVEIARQVTTHTSDTATTEKRYTATDSYLETLISRSALGERFGGQPIRVVHPDKTATVASYEAPTVPGGDKTEIVWTGNAGTDGLGDVAEGTRTTTVHAATGLVKSRKSAAIRTGAETVLDDMYVTAADDFGRPTAISWFPAGANGGSPKWTQTLVYNCCGLSSETDKNGVTTTHTYDALKRRIRSASSIGVVTATIYAGLTTSTHRMTSGAAGPGNMISKTVSNLARTLTSTGSPDPSALTNGVGIPGALTTTTTATSYSSAGTTTITNIGGTITVISGNFVVTGGHSQYTHSHPDGRLWKSTGTLAPAMIHTYGVNETGVLTTSAYLLDDSGEEPVTAETSTSQSDWAGRTVQTAKGTMVTNYYFYGTGTAIPNGSKGQLRAVRDADGVTTIYGYNALGERETTALARSEVTDPAACDIDYANDSVTTTQTVPATRTDGTTVLHTTTRVWRDTDTGTNPADGFLVSTADTHPATGQSWSWSAAAPNQEATTSTAPVVTVGLNFCGEAAASHISEAPADGFPAWTDSRAIGDESNPAVQADNTPLALGTSGIAVSWTSATTNSAGEEDDNEQALYSVYLDDGGTGVRVTITGLDDWLEAHELASYQIRCYSATDNGTAFQEIQIHEGNATGTVLGSLTPAVLGGGGFPSAPAAIGTLVRGYADSTDTLTTGTITLTIPARSNSIRGTLAAIKITGLGTAATPATSTPNGSWVESSQAPDGTRSVTSYSGGRPLSVTRYGSDNARLSSVIQGFDTLGRPAYTIDSRTGLSTTAYVSATCDAVASITDPGSRTTSFTYDSRGNRTQVNAPDTKVATGADLLNVTTTTYDSYGRVQSVTGDQAYPVSYAYDHAGRLKTMTTTGNVLTRWQYSETTGLLTGKFYDNEGTDTADGPTYAHTHAGRLLTRTWKRGIVTSYYYDLGGQLRAVDYPNDSATPDVLHTRDRLGRPTISVQGTLAVAPGTLAVSNTGITMSEAATLRGTTSIYDPTDFHLATETTNLGGFTRTFTRGVDAVGRLRTLAVGTDYTTAYGYDTAGRLQYVHPAATLPTTLAESDFTYGYRTNSYSLVQTVAGPAHTVSNTWEATRDVLATKINTTIATSNNIPSSFAYGVNAIGQRETLGPVLAGTTPVSTYTPKWTWDYNDRGELVSADHGADTTPDTLDRFYQYDDIGNRDYVRSGVFADLNGTLTDYSANALNQYTAIASAAPAHDADGNLTEDRGVNKASQDRQYIWDAENRLIAVNRVNSRINGVISTTTALISYQYDHLSRLVARTTTTATSEGAATTRYLYDGWNRIAEYSGQTLEKTYLWGMDLSGTMQGAGGVGGLLAVSEHSWSTGQTPVDTITSFYPTFDGNGNVTEYLKWVQDSDPVTPGDQSDAIVAAHFEYDAFGNLVVDTYSKASLFPFRFSTKPQDSVTGLYYYGYRWYDPLTGRWPSRDPIEDEGGVNLYGFVGNDGLDWVDDTGLEPKSITITGNLGGSSPGDKDFTWTQDSTEQIDKTLTPNARASFQIDFKITERGCVINVVAHVRFEKTAYPRSIISKRLKGYRDTNDEELKKAVDMFNEGISDRWNNKFKVCCTRLSGVVTETGATAAVTTPGKCCCDVRFSVAHDPRGYRVGVINADQDWSNENNWVANVNPKRVGGHEFGHLLGNIDEYGKARQAHDVGNPKKKYGPGIPQDPGSNVMSDANGPVLERHLWRVMEEINGSSSAKGCKLKAVGAP